MDVKGKVIVVTGAASGIGRGLCLRFAREGAQAIVAADVNEAGAKSVADEVKGIAVVCDVSKEEDMIRLARFAEDRYGRIDIFCSNAGILALGGYEVDNDTWQRIWEINVLSHVFAARAVLPGMIRRGGGAFMITASAAGLLSQIGSLPYSVTKHAAVGLAENLSITYGDQGISVFALCPQAVDTEMTRQGGGVAAVDGMMKPEKLADAVMEAFRADEFLILPHPEVKTYMQRKSSDYSRWLKGMRKLQERFATGSSLKK
ncbi:MAG: short-chain dehydrogenase [Deltaproteobacteria bacterium HGW-Deltaproteobacteria-9]|jgi:NAD(P)-dependent dehydrogenase (short-subunit alcohol dehydrogenase family)|nr:MAG: short-chain dehydrogenase [Deltaproteobacteria bacterium HGW-Deltaproteobacteria-9]PKN10825.1 MAG: short-chain dehydrogenase [Deltaproteobacteria bacterium HGW-Deltaproteobacteria-5]